MCVCTLYLAVVEEHNLKGIWKQNAEGILWPKGEEVPLDKWIIYPTRFHINYQIFRMTNPKEPIPVAARSKASLRGRWLAGIVGSIPTGVMAVSVLWVLCVFR